MREAAKTVARALASVIVLSIVGYYPLGRATWLARQDVRGMFTGARGAAWACGPVPSPRFLCLHANALRPYCCHLFWRRASDPGTRVGDGVYIGPFCTIGLADIGDDVLLAAGARVPSGPRTHGMASGTPIREQARQPVMITISSGAWIGNNAVVMADVGANAIVGAGAVVTHPVPPDVVAVGVPARVVRSRTAPASGSPP